MPHRQPERDPWELADDQFATWRAVIAERADDLGQVIDREARWALFALQSTLQLIAATPDHAAFRWMILHGALANGAPDTVVRIVVITRAGAPATIRADAWNDLSRIFAEAERTYALRFDCLMLREEDMEDANRLPANWSIILHDHVIVWSLPAPT
jgi:hypothetical protein